MKQLGIKIAIVDNGFVYVGRIIEDEHYFVVVGGFNVRKAGTTKGYGQLAFEGPQKESALDRVPPVMVPKARLCHFIDCNSVWEKHVK